MYKFENKNDVNNSNETSEWDNRQLEGEQRLRGLWEAELKNSAVSDFEV